MVERTGFLRRLRLVIIGKGEDETMSDREEPKDGLGFHFKFKIGKDVYEVNNEGKKEFEETINEIGLIVEQGRQKRLDKEMEKRVLKEK